MRQVLYIHGGEAFSDYNDFLAYLQRREIWDLPGTESSFKWTAGLVEALGPEYEVFMPKMPNRENARYDEWKLWFERYIPYLKDGAILIGCSLGAMFLTRYFSETTTPFAVSALILMAGAVEGDQLDGEDGGDFFAAPERLPTIAQKVDRVIIMHSKDDFVVPFEHGVRLHEAIPGSQFLAFEDKNHFLVEELPELIELLKGLG